jgi:uncharacterized membrane protein
MLLVLRILHIGAGVFWAGTVLFFGLLLEPSLRASGPAGGEVMRQLQARRYPIVMTTALVIAILSGIELLRRLIPGGPSSWVASSIGRTFVIGGSTALLTLLFGLTVVLPTVKRVGELAGRAASSGSQDPAAQSELARLRTRLTMMSRIAMTLVVVTVVSMAIARYV